jgi:hypothetical protein
VAAIHAREEATVEPDTFVVQQQMVIKKHLNFPETIQSPNQTFGIRTAICRRTLILTEIGQQYKKQYTDIPTS